MKAIKSRSMIEHRRNLFIGVALVSSVLSLYSYKAYAEPTRVQIGAVHYRLPASLDVSLDGKGNAENIPGFRFKLPVGQTSKDGFMAVSVNHPSRFSLAYRPPSRALPGRAISAVTVSALELDKVTHEAAVALNVARNDGGPQLVVARCFWRPDLPGASENQLYRCRIVLVLEDGNVLEMIVSPKGGSSHLLVENLKAVLRVVDGFERGNK